jgi:hypothetical protein
VPFAAALTLIAFYLHYARASGSLHVQISEFDPQFQDRENEFIIRLDYSVSNIVGQHDLTLFKWCEPE